MDNTALRRIFKQKQSSVHGRILKQYDNLEELNSSLSDKQKLEVLKKFTIELIHQELRNLRNEIIFYFEGREYKNHSIYDPDSK